GFSGRSWAGFTPLASAKATLRQLGVKKGGSFIRRATDAGTASATLGPRRPDAWMVLMASVPYSFSTRARSLAPGRRRRAATISGLNGTSPSYTGTTGSPSCVTLGGRADDRILRGDLLADSGDPTTYDMAKRPSPRFLLR